MGMSGSVMASGGECLELVDIKAHSLYSSLHSLPSSSWPFSFLTLFLLPSSLLYWRSLPLLPLLPSLTPSLLTFLSPVSLFLPPHCLTLPPNFSPSFLLILPHLQRPFLLPSHTFTSPTFLPLSLPPHPERTHVFDISVAASLDFNTEEEEKYTRMTSESYHI